MARFRFDPDRSAVTIEASSSVHPIHSRTEGVEGFVDLNVRGDRAAVPAHPAGGISLEVARLSSGNPLEDRELKRRIDARRFPTIEGRLTEMQETGTAGHYRVRGDVTFKGVTRAYDDGVTVTVVDGDTVRLEGSTTFDVRDFGMEPPRILVLRVHPAVRVSLDAYAVREKR
jgi:hypothetical protein